MSNLKKILIIITAIIIAGCATKTPDNPQDPFETYNRAMFGFNRSIDKWIIIPVAEVYDTILPNPAKTGVSNFFDNVMESSRIANDVLQFQIGWAIADTWRLIFNSTIGIGGLFDVATHFGLEKRTQDLGLTFAKWGAKNSPYFVIPILGPSTIRDGVGLFLDYWVTPYPYIDPWYLRWGLLSLHYVTIRADMLPTEDLINEAFDPYVFVRDAYLQRRAYLIEGAKEEEDTYVAGSEEQKPEATPEPKSST